MIDLKDIDNGDTVKITSLINVALPEDEIFTVEGGVSYNVAKRMDSTIESTHISNLPILPPETIKDPSKLDYVILTSNSTLEEKVFATDWIGTVTQINSTDFSVELNSFTPKELSLFKLLMANAGFGGRYTIKDRT